MSVQNSLVLSLLFYWYPPFSPLKSPPILHSPLISLSYYSALQYCSPNPMVPFHLPDFFSYSSYVLTSGDEENHK